MARQTYGGSVDDVVISPINVGGNQVAGLPAGQSFSVWDVDDTEQLTGILDGDGDALASDLVVASSTGQIPEFQGPDGYVGAVRLKHTVSGDSWIMQPNTVVVGPNTVVVSAEDSNFVGDFQCDGVADEVQIQAAIDLILASGGGTVLLTAGVYEIAASIAINGTGDPDTSPLVRLQGAGNYSTRLVGASGVHIITISEIARVHICDLGFEMTGAGDGIRATAVDDATYWRSFDESVFERLYLTGGYSGHTGIALNLGSAFRSSVRDIHIEGVKNGIKVAAEWSSQNPGDCTFDRMMIGISENSGIAYEIASPSSSLNQMLFTTCHGYAEPSATSTVGWKLSGAHGSNHIKTVNCNAEQFDTLVDMTAGFDADMRFVHVTAANGSTMFNMASSTYYNRFEIGELYVEPSATVTVVNDAGAGASAMPNRYRLSGYADTGSTLNATMGTAFLESGAWHGPGTIAAALRGVLPGVASRAVTMADGATITPDATRGSYHRVTLGGNRTLAAPTNPSDGQLLTLEIIQDGTGSRTLSWNAIYVFGTITNALTTTASKRDIFQFIYNATTAKFYVTTASKNL